jgi:dipeptide/tripeptide permease
MNEPISSRISQQLKIRFGIGFILAGLLLYILGINPAIFGLDRSPFLGFLQISVFLVGLGMICLGGFIALNALWNGTPKSIAADIGLRLVSTGYVFAFASAVADIFGYGAQTYPTIPYFGIWQTAGVIIGEILIIIGFILLIPRPGRKVEEAPG